MKFIQVLTITTLFFVALSCGNKSGNIEISGKLENAAGKMIYLLEMGSFDITPMDSVKISDKGQFQFDRKIENPRFLVLRETSANQVVLLVQPGEKITITGDLTNLRNTYRVEGSEDSELVRLLNASMQKTINKLDSLSSYYQANLGGTEEEIESLRAKVRLEFEKIANAQREFTIDFISRNTASLASLMALYQQVDPTTMVLNREEDFKYYILVDSVLMSIYPNLDYAITLNENVRDMKDAIRARDIGISSLSTGAVAPDIELPNPEGKIIKLSDLKGQYVLLDFWAAWCGPCRHENPYLVDAYEKFNNKGFTIYQVSLDRTREAWLKGIEDDKLGKWHHVSDLKFWNSVVVPLYQIEGIPANFLLDKEGRIIARNLRGLALGAKLAEVLD